MEIRISDPVPHLRLYPILAKIPDAQILWVGPEVCSRHGMMTFLHGGLRGTLSFFCYREIDAITGDYVKKIEEAALEIIRERDASCLILCTICQGAVLGTDVDSLKKSITEKTGVPVEYVVTNRLFMHSARRGEMMNRKPEQLLFSFLKPKARDEAFSVNILDRVFETEESDLHAFLYSSGVKEIRTLPECRTREDYQKLAGAHLNVVTDPSMKQAAEEMEKTLGIPWADMSAVYDPAGLAEQYEILRDRIGGDPAVSSRMQHLVRKKMDYTRQLLDGHSLQMDPMGTDHARELSRWFRSEGIDTPEVRGGPGRGGPGGPGRGRRRHAGGHGMRGDPGRGMHFGAPHPGGPGGPPAGLPSFGGPQESGPRPVAYSACLRILDRVIETAEAALETEGWEWQ